MPSANRMPRPLRGARNAAQRIYDTLAGVRELQTEVSRLSNEVSALGTGLAALAQAADAHHAEAVELFRVLIDDEPESRRRLWRLREGPEYARAWEEPEPLVSVCIATYENIEQLMERALPSVLRQTYERIEVVIVGDAAAPDVERAVKGVGDPRVRYANLTFRGPYPETPEAFWYVAGGPPSNEAMRLAKGRWIASMDDDDESMPNRIEVLLRAARERTLEFCYGQIEQQHPDGSTRLLCEFPPAYGRVNLQASLMHTDLRFICAELSDFHFDVPGDWSRIRRMMRIGVRMGMIDDVVVRYYPGFLWRSTDADAQT